MVPAIEKIEKKSKKRGGKRKGSGRKKGKVSEKTLEKKKVEKAIEQKIMRQVDGMLRAQFTLAKGCSYLYVIRTKTDSKGRETKEKPELVTNPEVIEMYLAGELEGERDEYHYITTDKPDNLAINSLMDRVFGKPKQKVVGGDEDDAPVKVNVVYLPTPDKSDE